MGAANPTKIFISLNTCQKFYPWFKEYKLEKKKSSQTQSFTVTCYSATYAHKNVHIIQNDGPFALTPLF